MSSYKFVNKDAEPIVAEEVTWEDQQRIIQYSKNMTKLLSVQARISNLKVLQQNLDDAQAEVFMVDDERIGTSFGEVFFDLTQDETIAQLEKTAERHKELFDNYEAEEQRLQKLLAKLKIQLTSKFGQSINLEFE